MSSEITVVPIPYFGTLECWGLVISLTCAHQEDPRKTQVWPREIPPNSQTSNKWLLCPQLLPDPLSEVHGDLSLAEACNFLGILERVLAKEAAPLGPAALLAVVHFLKRVTVLGAGEPEPLAGPWEQLGQGIVSVASLVLEEQLADAWLSVSEVRLAGLGEAGGPGLWFHPCLQLVV